MPRVFTDLKVNFVWESSKIIFITFESLYTFIISSLLDCMFLLLLSLHVHLWLLISDFDPLADWDLPRPRNEFNTLNLKSSSKMMISWDKPTNIFFVVVVQQWEIFCWIYMYKDTHIYKDTQPPKGGALKLHTH